MDVQSPVPAQVVAARRVGQILGGFTQGVGLAMMFVFYGPLITGAVMVLMLSCWFIVTRHAVESHRQEPKCE